MGWETSVTLLLYNSKFCVKSEEEKAAANKEAGSDF